MMKFTEILDPKNIRQGVIFSSKKRLFECIAECVTSQIQREHCKQEAFECLFNREKLGNSGLGLGVAMPKGKLPVTEITHPLVIFLQLASPIDYGSADGKEVDLVFTVLVPQNNCTQYIPLLAELSKKLLDKNLLKQLRAAKSADEIWQVFQMADNQAEPKDKPEDEQTDFAESSLESSSEAKIGAVLDND